MKRQIHAVRGHAALATRGHNLKLGRGGIREIEFFVQTQQLIAGGRDVDLRGHRTVEMLDMLAEKNWINQATAQGLRDAYFFLRRMEHRLQMRLDEQTQTLPQQEEEFTRFARFAGYETVEAFEQALMQVLQYVTQEYGLLFEQAESLSADTGNLVFTGAEDDPETLETLMAMGFQRPKDVSAFIRGWHAGRLRATRTARSREILTRLQPQILKTLAKAADPDYSFLQFQSLLETLPSGVQIFSLFQSNPHLLALLGDIVSIAPRLIAFLSGNGKLVDMLVTNNSEPNVSIDAFVAENPSLGFEEIMEELRLQVHEGQFQIGTRVLAEPVTAAGQGRLYTKLAEQSVVALLSATLEDMRRQYGDISGGQLVILGMGKFGSREMTLQSDLDIIFVCDCDDFHAMSDGAKSISAEQWFSRAARRFLSGLSAPTAQGRLFEVDTRLRPSGNAGALVSKLSGFIDYQSHHAWNWERLALTRARVVAGDADLSARVMAAIGASLATPRKRDSLADDIADMRDKLLAHQPQRGPFDIRRGKGGLVELEFACQTLQLAHCVEDARLIGVRDLVTLIYDLQDGGFLSDADYAAAQAAAQCFATLRQIASLCLQDDETTPAPAIQNFLLEALNEPDMARLRDSLATHRGHIEGILTQVLSAL